QGYRGGHLLPGQPGENHRGWRRILLRQQTELNRLHGRPPCTVTSVQPAPGRPRAGRKDPKPAQTAAAGPEPIPESPPRRPPRPRADPRSRQRAAPPPRPERRYSHRGRSQPPADRPEHPRRCSRRSAASASRQNTAARPHPARPPQPRSRPPHLPAAEYLPAGFHGNVEEIPAEKPRAVPDQELNSRLRGKQAFRPRAHPGGKVIEA